MPRHPGRVERVGRMSGRGSPALAGALHMPSPPGRGEEAGRMDGRTSGESERKRSGRREGRENEEEEKKQQAESKRRQDGRQFRGAAPLLAVGCWLIGGEVVAITSHRVGAVCPLFPLLCLWCDPVSGWRWCGRWGQQTEQKRGEELARMAAASLALFLSHLPFRLRFCPSFPVCFCSFFIYNKVYNITINIRYIIIVIP